MGRGGGFSNPVPRYVGPKDNRAQVVEVAFRVWRAEGAPENVMPTTLKRAMEAGKVLGSSLRERKILSNCSNNARSEEREWSVWVLWRLKDFWKSKVF